MGVDSPASSAVGRHVSGLKKWFGKVETHDHTRTLGKTLQTHTASILSYSKYREERNTCTWTELGTLKYSGKLSVHEEYIYVIKTPI